jgi:hypothetical protein
VARELVEQRAHGVDRAGSLPREQLQREQRRAAAGRAFVLEAAPQQLELLAEAELADGAIRLRADAVVGVPRGGLDLLVPLRAQLGQGPHLARLRELVGAHRGLGERHAWTDSRERDAGPT